MRSSLFVISGLHVIVCTRALQSSPLGTRSVFRQDFRGYSSPCIKWSAGQPTDAAVVFVHGFGSSGKQWRAAGSAIAAAGGIAYALDLLGLGMSDKPELEYSIDLWADQLVSFVEALPERRIAVVGNSLGSVVSLRAAPRSAQAVALYNCAVGMNSKAKPLDAKELITWPVSWAAQPIFFVLDLVLKSRIAKGIFDTVRRADNVAAVLRSPGVYYNTTRVDDALLDMILEPAQTEGALQAFVAIFTGDPGPRPERIVRNELPDDIPLAVFWGDRDLVTPITGPVGRFFRTLPDQRPNTSFTVLMDVAHCPFDEAPELTVPPLLDFLREYRFLPPAVRS